MTLLSNNAQNRIARPAGNQGARPLMGNQIRVEKRATGPNNKSTMTMISEKTRCHITRLVVDQEVRLLVGDQIRVKKLATGATHKPRILKAKQTVKVATFNTRTLNSSTKLNKLAALSEKV